MDRYVEYTRVSTAKQGESGLGLESQQSVIEHFAQKGEIIARYQDVMSGKTMEGRVDLRLAIDHCKRENAKLIVAKADRLSRDVQDALAVMDELGEGNLVCCDCPNSDRFTMTIIFAVAERERLLISLRTKAALAAKRRRGWVPQGRKGFSNANALKKARMVNRKKSSRYYATIIELVKDLRVEGSTYRQIADKLNKYGNKTINGCAFKPITVKRILELSKPIIENEKD